MRERFLIVSDVIGLAKTSTLATGNQQLLVFPRLKGKKVFVVKLLVAVHNLQLELLDEVREMRQAIPQQREVDGAVDMAAHAARYAADHIVVSTPSPPTLDN